MEAVDPGHRYKLNLLDDEHNFKFEVLTFVKREGEKYPDNVGHHAGTTIQEVCRALIDRCKYVNNQERCGETEAAITYLRKVIVELESRAAKRHGRKVHMRLDVESMPTCKICGHIGCEESCRKKPEEVKLYEPQIDSPMATGDGLTT